MNASETWSDWMAAQGPSLLLFARRWTVDQAAAEDLVQEAFVRFWRTRQEVRDPLLYLYQCVRTTAIDAARSRQSRKLRETAVLQTVDPAPQFVCTLEQEERRLQIEAALAELPVEQAEVVTLKIWSSLTFAQIAELTSTSGSTVASRYRYALDRLRHLLQEAGTQ
ncbi:RNA polymerase sigma factor [Lignipirellula cremea]|uniref:ECF RNA polymerase sigma factor SigL n=1 Tax=Lignipirellula cremea TaxID=2528010 RepID=A0A518DWA7_9BACT|nr:RNA polymerase sigma factor [Lignipirellula cremea]QDU96114.1 ECF RNA polymerase sigma factor SigL [Lignipirellula cremea]